MSIVLPSLIGANKPAGGGAFPNQYSVSFDGSDDYMSVTQDSAINISGDISLSAWINRTSTSGYNAIYTKRVVFGSMNYQFTINNSNGKIGLGHSGGSFVYNTTTTLSTNTWYHVAVTVSSGTAQFYVNGVVGDSFTGISITATTQDLILGATVGFNYFGGLIDEASIFNSALSASDISTLRGGASAGTLGLPADISSLNPVAWWRMGDGSDGSGNADGTVVGGLPQIYNVAEDGSGNRITGIDGSLTNIASPNGIVTDVPS